jgi:hypothetical protein
MGIHVTIFLAYLTKLPNVGVVKVNLSPCLINSALCNEDIRGSGDIAPLFLIAALHGGEWSATSPCRFTLPGKNPRYPLDRRLCGPESAVMIIEEDVGNGRGMIWGTILAYAWRD